MIEKYRMPSLTTRLVLLPFTLFLLCVPSVLLPADHFIPHKEKMEHYAWTRGCAPTAAATVLSYINNRYLGYSGLIRWYKLPSGSTYQYQNVPQLLDWLADEMETNAEGTTRARRIPRGIDKVANNYCGYSFKSRRTTDSIFPWAAGYDWCWNLIKTEIDGGRPLIWSSYPKTGEIGHALAVLGYSKSGDDKRVIVLDSNRRAMTYWRYNFWEYYPRGQAESTAVVRITTGGGDSASIRLSRDWDPGVIVCGEKVSVDWFHNGSEQIKKVKIFFSDDFGHTWEVQTDYIDSSLGMNSYEWKVPFFVTSPGECLPGRLKILGYDENNEIISGDGNFSSFRIHGADPRIFLRGTMDFQEVALGSTATRYLEIHNHGNATLNISGIINPEGFSGNWAGDIPPGEFVYVPILFTPEEERDYDGFIEVASNFTSGFHMIPCSGTGKLAEQPFLNIAPLALNLEGTDTTGTFTVSNTGTGMLKWAVEPVDYNEGDGWITSVLPGGGNTVQEEPETVTVEVSRSGLAPGAYTAEFMITSDGGEQTVSVSMEIQESLVMAVYPEGGGETFPPAGEHGYDVSALVEISALPAAGYVFSHWEGNVSNQYSGSTTVTMDKAQAVTAHFLIPDFHGGDGSFYNPWQITTPLHLDNVRHCTGTVHAGKHFKVMNDIDLSAYLSAGNGGYNMGMFWEPIGERDKPFQGILEGNENKITGMQINRPGSDYTGLFAFIGEDGIVNNITVETAAGGRLSGRDFVGGLVGENSGHLVNCHVSGAIEGEYDVGGLVGKNYGIIRECSASGTVSGKSGIGGLIGVADGWVIKSHATSDVSGENNGVGGLVGYNIYGTISECYATGSASGSNDTGGLAGFNQWESVIENSYATGEVSGNIGVGGLVGTNLDGIITKCYSAGRVSGNGDVGGLAGFNDEFFGGIRDSFWDTETSQQDFSAGGEGKKTDDMQVPATFEARGWDFNITWNIDPGDTYPYLRPRLGVMPETPGDINQDDEVNISDVILCLRMAIGLPVTIGEETYGPPDETPYPQWLRDIADMNDDEDVNISDVILILRKAIGLDE